MSWILKEKGTEGKCSSDFTSLSSAHGAARGTAMAKKQTNKREPFG